MNIKKYLDQRKLRDIEQPKQRIKCKACQQPHPWCYCADLKPFDSGIIFAILLHPLERRRRIATGRMSHLMLKNSQLIQGYKFNRNRDVEKLIHDSQNHCVLLCLGDGAKDLDLISDEGKKQICPAGKKLVVFVIDGTWGTASKTVRLSENLKKLPRICFSPKTPSAFRVRQQPKENCYSTIEAIHRTIELIGGAQGFDLQSRKHDQLLRVFEKFVGQQADYVKRLKAQNAMNHRIVRKTRG